MDLSIALEYLKKLAANNNKEWFNLHRDEYDRATAEFELFVARVIDRISLFDESVKRLQPKDCTYRIYRDVRFSPDKTPYKTHFGGYINAHGKKSERSGYYVHLQPGGGLLAGGCYCPSPKLLKALRQAVYDNIEEYCEIVEDATFKQYFPTIGYTFLKTAPKGFPKDFEYIDYLKCKEYCCNYDVPDSFFTSPGVVDRCGEAFEQLKRFSDFLNYTIDECEEE